MQGLLLPALPHPRCGPGGCQLCQACPSRGRQGLRAAPPGRCWAGGSWGNFAPMACCHLGLVTSGFREGQCPKYGELGRDQGSAQQLVVLGGWLAKVPKAF